MPKRSSAPRPAPLAWALHEALQPGWRTRSHQEVDEQLRGVERAREILSGALPEGEGQLSSSEREEVQEALERLASKELRLAQLKRELRLPGGPTFFGLSAREQVPSNPYSEGLPSPLPLTSVR